MPGAVLATALCTLGACAAAPHKDALHSRPERPQMTVQLAPPDPGSAVAADIALAKLVRDAGPAKALRDTASKEATLFVPRPVFARDWLGRRDYRPAATARREPHKVWISCDGSLALTTGSWTDAAGSGGWFLTAWERDKNGMWRWTLNEAERSPDRAPPPGDIVATVASCEQLPPTAVATVPVVGLWRGGGSHDGSLYWAARVDPQCGRILTVRMNGGAGAGFAEVVNRRIDPPRPAAACNS